MEIRKSSDLDPNLAQKITTLKAILESKRAMLIAFSGGVDSSFLLAVASEVLSGNVVALMTISSSTPPQDAKQATQLAKKLGVELLSIQHNELAIPEYTANPVNRCYFCKNSLYEICRRTAERLSLPAIADGVNLDDLGDYRPGLQAAEEYGVFHPLVEARFTKEEIRQASRARGLRTWSKPASPCLSSRVPYGTRITAKMLLQISQAESFLQTLGVEQLRVRYNGRSARIEIDKRVFSKITSQEALKAIGQKLKGMGIPLVTLDLEGYKSGVFNVGFDVTLPKTEAFA